MMKYSLVDIKPISETIKCNLQHKLKDSMSLSILNTYMKSVVKRFIKCILRGKKAYYAIENRSLFWVNGQYAYGLLCTHDVDSIKCLDDFYFKVKLTNSIGITKFNTPDTILHAYVLMKLIAEYGYKKYANLVHQAANYIKKETILANNLIRYREPIRKFYIDSLGMMVGFCYLYGRTYNDKKMISIAENQIDFTLNMIKQYQSTFPYHAYDIDSGIHFGTNMWGRGVGWFLLGLTEAAINNPEKYQQDYQLIVDAVFEYQNPEGFFYDDFLLKNHIDTSITSMAALSLAQGLKFQLLKGNLEKYDNYLNLCLSSLISCCTDSGAVINCSGECGIAGKYANSFGDYFAQGYTLALFHVLEDI